MKKKLDLIIIGGGAAGLSASLLAARSLRSVLIIDSGQPRNRFAEHMHGVLGHEGKNPLDLVKEGRAEAESYGVEFYAGSVISVTEKGRDFTVTCESGEEFEARSIIVATGMTDLLADVAGLKERWGKSVLHCPYCHGYEVRGQKLGIITGSNLEQHRTELLRQLSDDVTVFTPGFEHISAEAATRLESRGVKIVRSPAVEVIGEDDTIQAVRTEDGQEFDVDAVFAGGFGEPHDWFLKDLNLERNESPLGSFIAIDPMGLTSHPKVWAVGNVVNPSATVPVAMSMGSMAGAMANAVLTTEDFEDAV